MKNVFEARGYNDPAGWPAASETYRIGIFVNEDDAIEAAKDMGVSGHGDGSVEPIQVYEAFGEFAEERDRKQKEDERAWREKIERSKALYKMDLILDYIALDRYLKAI